jgi:hypothetical protein
MATTSIAADRETEAWAPALPWLAGAGVYLVVMLVGNSLLNDSDSYWHIVVGQWVLAHGFPRTDPFSFTFAGKPWIAKEWLSQLLYFGAYRLGGWAAVVTLAAGAIALAFGLLTKFLQERLAMLPTVALVAVAFILVTPHALARPHVLALPLLVAWVGGLLRAADRGKTPPLALLALMVIWANLHAGFSLGILLVGAIGLDAIVSADAAARRQVALVWIRFGALALVAGCITPYGPQSLLVTRQVLSLGPALSIIGEWKPADFSHLAGFEMALLLGSGFALYRGLVLPPVRILILLGLLHMALSAERNGEVLGLLAPLLLAAPLARQFPQLRGSKGVGHRHVSPMLFAGLAVALVAATAGLISVSTYQPNTRITPAAAVAALKAANVGRVFNDYDLGGYLVFAGVPTFIDGRTELFGGDFTARVYRAATLADLNDFVALLDEYKIGATLLEPSVPAVALLDRLPGWKRLYADDTAVVHVRLPLRGTVQ